MAIPHYFVLKLFTVHIYVGRHFPDDVIRDVLASHFHFFHFLQESNSFYYAGMLTKLADESSTICLSDRLK